MAKFVLCSLPDGRDSFINIERVTFVVRIDGNKSLVGFGEDINEGLIVTESVRDILATETLYEH